jgi:pimeloyl-ACP methyl ester carboxylesterase
MPRPLVLIHGYSAEGIDFRPVKDALAAKGIDPQTINICNYISLNNEVTIKDIAEGLDRALRVHPALRDDNQDFDAIVHSTGMLVVRSWLTNNGAPPDQNRRLARLKHLVGLAPATWGSPQAHKGRTWLGALVKGNKHVGPDFLNAGDQVLDGLELGSKFIWDLAHRDLLGPRPYYDRGRETPYVAVFIGNQPYEGIASVANDPGTDGTVRWAGCGLNTRKITIDLTQVPVGSDGRAVARATISPWAANRLDVPIIPVDHRNHGSLISEPENGMVQLVADFLKVGEAGNETYDAWLTRANAYGDQGRQPMLINPGAGAAGASAEFKKFFGHIIGQSGDAVMEGWQQFVVHTRDERGDGIQDYMIEVLTRGEDGQWIPFTDMYTDVHAYGADSSYRCFHVRLPRGLAAGTVPLKARIRASTGTQIMAYQGYGANDLTQPSEAVELDITNLGDGQGSLFCPFTTTLIEIVLNREPLPLDKESDILKFI